MKRLPLSFRFKSYQKSAIEMIPNYLKCGVRTFQVNGATVILIRAASLITETTLR